MDQSPENKPSFFNLITSVFAAIFGVQSDKNRQKDFSTKNATPFIVAGLIGVILFVLSIVLVVKLIV